MCPAIAEALGGNMHTYSETILAKYDEDSIAEKELEGNCPKYKFSERR